MVATPTVAREFTWRCVEHELLMTVQNCNEITSCSENPQYQLYKTYFFCLMAAWLNEGRCPGGRPSVSTNYITIEASVFCIEMTTVHAICKHRIKLAVSQRVPFR